MEVFMTIQCTTIETNHLFRGNLIASQHKLRYHSIIERQEWTVPAIKDMEYDQYDNPSSTYLVWTDNSHNVGGVSRLYPTDRPFMLKEYFTYMVDTEIPTGENVLEGSRFCVDKRLPVTTRQRVANELVAAYFEYGLHHKMDKIVGIMHPIYWKNLFLKNDIIVTWLGKVVKTPDGKEGRAGYITISKENQKKFLDKTGLSTGLVSYGHEEQYSAAA